MNVIVSTQIRNEASGCSELARPASEPTVPEREAGVRCTALKPFKPARLRGSGEWRFLTGSGTESVRWCLPPATDSTEQMLCGPRSGGAQAGIALSCGRSCRPDQGNHHPARVEIRSELWSAGESALCGSIWQICVWDPAACWSGSLFLHHSRGRSARLRRHRGRSGCNPHPAGWPHT